MWTMANIEKLPEHQTYVNIVNDEMSVKEDIVYNKHTGEHIGFINLSNFNESILPGKQTSSSAKTEVPNVANKIFVIFVKAPTFSFKYTYTHFPSHNLNEREMQTIVWTAVENLENAGFKGEVTRLCNPPQN